MRTVLFCVLMCLSLFGCRYGTAAQPSAASLRLISTKNEDAVLKYLRPSFKDSRMGGRIYYQANCEPNAQQVLFPEVKVEQPHQNKIDLEAVRQIFKNTENVHISGDSGIIRIKIGDVSEKIMQTHISILKFNSLDQYTPESALMAIANNADVRAAEHQSGYHEAPEFVDILMVQPAKGLPHLPVSMKNVTLDQALDIVARTFSGIVLYGACTQSHLYSIDFSGGFYFEEEGQSSGQ